VTGTAQVPTVTAVMRLNISCTTSKADKTFNSTFVQDVCHSFNPPISTSRFRIDNVSCGSTLVTFTILPPTDPTDTSATGILAAISTQLATPGSPLLAGNVTGQAFKSQNILSTAVTTQVEKCSSGSAVGQYLPVGTCPGTADSTGVDKSLALGLGLGFGIPYCIVLAIVIYRSKQNAAKLNEHLSNLSGRGGGGGGGGDIQMKPIEKKENEDAPPGLESPTKEDEVEQTPLKDRQTDTAPSPSTDSS